MVKLRAKLEITGTKWEKFGDHPQVQEVPYLIKSQLAQQGVPTEDIQNYGMLGNTIFKPIVWIIDCGGNTFCVEQEYFDNMYEIINEEDQENVIDK